MKPYECMSCAGTHSFRGLGMGQRGSSGSFGPLPCVTNFIPDKTQPKYPIFLRTVLYNYKKKHLSEVLACKVIHSQTLKCFHPLIILSIINVLYSSYCTNPWSSVKHLIFQTPLMYLAPHFRSYLNWDFGVLSLLSSWPRRFMQRDDSRAGGMKNTMYNHLSLGGEDASNCN